MTAQIRDLLDGYQDRRAKWRKNTSNTLRAAQALDFVDELLATLDLHVHPVEPDTDDRLEQVVLTIHGVEISVRGRIGDLFVHVEDRRDDDTRGEFPLVVGVGEGNENEYS